MRIAVLSDVNAGHVPAYHRMYVEEFRAAGCDVVDLGPSHGKNESASTARRPPWRGWAARFLESFAWGRDLKARRRGRNHWRATARKIAEAARGFAPADFAVFMPYLDIGFLDRGVSAAEVDLLFSYPWAGVVTGPLAVRGMRGSFVGGEGVLAAKQCRAIVVTDPTFVSPCERAWPGKTVITMPEVADVSAPIQSNDLKQLLHWKGARRLVGLLGVIGAKKNVASFLRLARLALIQRPDLAFVLAGDFSAQACPESEHRELTVLFASLPANCRLFPAPIPDGPIFNGWVAACDVLWLAYRDVYYKSNILTKAAHFGRPVVVSSGRVMAAHVKEYRLGEIVLPEDTEAVLAAVDRLLDDPVRAGDHAGFAELNGRQKLAQTVSLVLAALRA